MQYICVLFSEHSSIREIGQRETEISYFEDTGTNTANYAAITAVC